MRTPLIRFEFRLKQCSSQQLNYQQLNYHAQGIIYEYSNSHSNDDYADDEIIKATSRTLKY